jgi:hypothetical protein
MTRRRVAIVDLGRLGAACLDAFRAVPDLELAGVVRRPESGAAPHGVRIAAHVRDLGRVDAALVCVPAMHVAGVARELLQARIAVVECAVLEDRARDEHYAAIGDPRAANEWLDRPSVQLGGRSPRELIGTKAGAHRVEELLAQIDDDDRPRAGPRRGRG